MHRSRLCSILLDCSADTMEAGVHFWQQALGTTGRHTDDPTSPYVTLEGGAGGLQLSLQEVHDASRIHLDIETDNVEAEVQRLRNSGRVGKRPSRPGGSWKIPVVTSSAWCPSTARLSRHRPTYGKSKQHMEGADRYVFRAGH